MAELTFRGPPLRAVIEAAVEQGLAVCLCVTSIAFLAPGPRLQQPRCYAEDWAPGSDRREIDNVITWLDLQLPEASRAVLRKRGARLEIVITEDTITVTPHPPPPRRPRQPKAGA